MNELQNIETEISYSVSVSQDIIIHNQLTLEKASDFVKGIKTLQKKVEETFNPIIQKALASHREAIAQRDKHLNPLKQAEAEIKNRISGYLAECERKRRDEELRLQREAEEKAAKERAKLEAKAEKALEQGKNEKAEELLEKAENVEAVTPVVMPTVQKVNGISTRKTWRAEVTDFKALPDEYKIADQRLLDSIARATRGQKQIPGVEMISEDIVAVR